MSPAPDPVDHVVMPDATAWRTWLEANEATHDGLWLVLAKKGVTEPTSLTYDEALLEALCGGWIDGQKHSRDATTFLQRFTPRRRASIWSVRNVGLVADLIEQGRMRERGHAEIDRAKADGRWERAYEGQARAEVTEDFALALAASPAASSAFDAFTRAERYSVLHPVISASPTNRAARIARIIAKLEADSSSSPESSSPE